MARYVAFLRAINVGGRVVKMDELRRLFEALNLSRVETFIASGNVIFESAARDMPALRKKIESGLHSALGYEVETFLRSDAEVARIAAHAAFPAAAVKAATVVNVGLLHQPLGAEAVKQLDSFRSDVDDFHASGREVYWLCRIRSSESAFFKVPFEKRFQTRVTFRNLNTITKIAARYPPK